MPTTWRERRNTREARPRGETQGECRERAETPGTQGAEEEGRRSLLLVTCNSNIPQKRSTYTLREKHREGFVLLSPWSPFLRVSLRVFQLIPMSSKPPVASSSSSSPSSGIAAAAAARESKSCLVLPTRSGPPCSGHCREGKGSPKRCVVLCLFFPLAVVGCDAVDGIPWCALPPPLLPDFLLGGAMGCGEKNGFQEPRR